MSFWGELKRRNVYKVGVAYAIVAWLIIQAVAIIFPAQHLPGWTVTFVIALLIIGFPLILLFAWAFEITPEGIKRTKEVPIAESITHLTGQKLNYIVTGLLVVAVGFILVKDFYIDRQAVKPEVVTKVPEQAPSVINEVQTKKTIAVIPFVNLSPDPDQEYFVDGLSEELLNSLTNIPDLRVTARTSSFTFKGSDKKVNDIANELGVAHILEGSVRKADSMLRVTAQLVRASDGFHLWSKTYDRELKDIFAVQEDIANSVADELKVTFGIEGTRRQLGGTENVEAYEHYLIAQGQYQGGPWNLSSALESINAAIALDPEFALAWALKAQIHNAPSPDFVREQDVGLDAAMRAIELEPNLPAGYFSLGFIKTCNGDWIEAESAYRKAVELITDPSLKHQVLHPYHYLSLGYFDRALELIEASLRNDSLNTRDRQSYIYCLALLGDIQKAREENERCKALFGDQFMGYDFTWMTPIGPDDLVSSDPKLMQFLRENCLFLMDDEAIARLETPKDVLEELRRCFNEENNQSCNPMTIMYCAAFLGDSDLSMDGMEKLLSMDKSSTWMIWVPPFKEVRQTPRFKEYVKEIGLVDYWNKFGWPDICRPLDNGDFECD